VQAPYKGYLKDINLLLSSLSNLISCNLSSATAKQYRAVAATSKQLISTKSLIFTFFKESMIVTLLLSK
jgi:hypothetical protein